MENATSTPRVSGATIILCCCAILGIISSAIYSGYLAIALGTFSLLMVYGTKLPEAGPGRTLTLCLASISLALGIGAIALGVIARTLGQFVS